MDNAVFYYITKEEKDPIQEKREHAVLPIRSREGHHVSNFPSFFFHVKLLPHPTRWVPLGASDHTFRSVFGVSGS